MGFTAKELKRWGNRRLNKLRALPQLGPWQQAGGDLASPRLRAFPFNAIVSTVVAAAAESGATLPAQGSILAHWSASDLPLTEDGMPVSSWVDQVSGLTAAQAEPSMQPTYRANRLNGKASVQFDGGQMLSAGSPAEIIGAMAAGTVSIMVVFRGIQAASNAALFCATVAQTNSWLIQADGTRVGRYNGGSLAVQPLCSGADFTTLIYTVNDVSAFASEGRLERVFLNGGCVASSFGMGVTPNDAIGLGGRAADGALGLKGEVFEYVIWSGAVTQAEALQAQAWVCAEYGQPLPWASGGGFLAIHGDSLPMGTGTSVPEETYPSQLAQQLGLSYGQWGNLGVGGVTIPTMSTLAAQEIDPIAGIVGAPTVLSVFEYYNSRGPSPGPEDQMVAYLQGRRLAGCLIALATTTDSYLAPEADRAAYNAFLDANHAAYADSFAQIHLDSRIGVEGTCGPSQPSTYFQDQIGHLTPLGYSVLAGLVAPHVAELI